METLPGEVNQIDPQVKKTRKGFEKGAFIRAWNSAKDPMEVSEITGHSKVSCIAYAFRLRQAKVSIKRFPRGRKKV